MFIRVKDPSTGHEFDVPEGSALLTRGLVRLVERPGRWPASRMARPPKYAAMSRRAHKPTMGDTPDQTTTEESENNG